MVGMLEDNLSVMGCSELLRFIDTDVVFLSVASIQVALFGLWTACGRFQLILQQKKTNRRASVKHALSFPNFCRISWNANFD